MACPVVYFRGVGSDSLTEFPERKFGVSDYHSVYIEISS